MKKNEIDMLNGSLWDKILIYAIPLAVTGILQQLFNAADLAVVGRFRGPEAMAAVGSNAPVIGLLINMFIGISLGTNVVLANAIGAKDNLRVKHCVHSSILLSVIGGIFVMIIGEAATNTIIHLMGVPEECAKLAALYLRIYLMGMPVILLYNFEASIYRAIGDTKTPFWALVISGVVNVVLNILLVCGANMSVDGVAIATVVSNVISSLYLLHGLVQTDSSVHVDFEQLKINKPVLIRILRIGIPAGIQGMVFSISNLIIQSSINSLGSKIMAASAAAMNLEIFSYFIVSSFGSTCTTFVGQNNGAKKYDRCKRSLLICLGLDYLFTIICGIILLTYYKQLLGIFCQDPEVIELGYIRIYWFFIAFFFSVLQECFAGYLRGFGISTAPAIISLVGICGIRLIWIFVVFPLVPTFTTIMQVYPLSLAITAVGICLLAFMEMKRKSASAKL